MSVDIVLWRKGFALEKRGRVHSMRIVPMILVSALGLGWGAQAGSSAEAPKDNKGFTASKTTVVELGPEIEGMAGRQLRLRVLTIEPGGHIGIHSHKDRPAVVYLIQGTDTVGSADGTTKTLHPGDTSSATRARCIGIKTTGRKTSC